ncbi:MAG TPA: hypothetical protein VG389_16570 [Myxococcota bacterium]|nr:hypothetical protein [Myxococcota bacterium]
MLAVAALTGWGGAPRALAAPASAAGRTPRAPPGLKRAGAVVFFASGLSDADLVGFLAVLDSRLGKAGVRLRSGRDADARIPPGGLPDYCADSPPCLRDAAARLEVDRLVLLLFTVGGGRLRLEAVMADGASGMVLNRLRRDAKLDTTALAAAAQEIAERVVDPPAGKLRIVTTLRGADVTVSDTVVGRAPLAAPVAVPAGNVTVTVRRGSVSSTARVWVEGGTEGELLVGVERGAGGGALRSPWLWGTLGVTFGLAAGFVAGWFVLPEVLGRR